MVILTIFERNELSTLDYRRLMHKNFYQTCKIEENLYNMIQWSTQYFTQNRVPKNTLVCI